MYYLKVTNDWYSLLLEEKKMFAGTVYDSLNALSKEWYKSSAYLVIRDEKNNILAETKVLGQGMQIKK